MSADIVPRVRDSVLADALDKGSLVFPGLNGGEPETYAIYNWKADPLRNLCVRYGLAKGGKKADLINRLEALSIKYCNDPSAYIAKTPRKSHKGPRVNPQTGSITTKAQARHGANKVALRRQKLMNTNPDTQRSKDMRTVDQIEGVKAWVAFNVARFQYKPKAAPGNENTGPAPVPDVGSTLPAIPRPLVTAPTPTTSNNLAPVVVPSSNVQLQAAALPTTPAHDHLQWMRGVALQINGALQDTGYSPSSQTPPASAQSAKDVTTSGPTFSSSSGLSTDLSAYIATAPPIAADRMEMTVNSFQFQSPIFSTPRASVCPDSAGSTRSFRIGNGTIITMDPATLRLPTINYSRNVDALFEQWDDTHTGWKATSPIIIDTHPIALKYIRTMFINTKSWDALKTKYDQWKHIFAYYHNTPLGTFWSQFTDQHGTRLAYAKLVEAIRAKRAESAKDIVAKARAEYPGALFPDHFSYKKKGKTYLMTKDSSIVKRYLQLTERAVDSSHS